MRRLGVRLCLLCVAAAASAQDTDRDGLPDSWEFAGYDADGNGTIDEPLDRFGADRFGLDVFVEIDWMAEENGGDGMRMRMRAIAERIGGVLARGGIRAHFDIGPVMDPTPVISGFGPHAHGGTLCAYQPVFRSRPRTRFVESGSTLYSLYHDPHFFRESRRNVFYYVFIAAQRQPDDVGTALVDRFDDDESAALGLRDAGVYAAVIYRRAFPDDERLGTTLLHELGHAFGLGHGGVLPDGSWDNTEGKLNYISVMNPLYQFGAFGGPDGDGLFDFSDGSRSPLTEMSLDEGNGMGPFVREEILALLGYARVRNSPFRWNIDWNGNGAVDGFAYARDVNRDGEIAPAVWVDHDDWGRITSAGFDGIGTHAFGGTRCGRCGDLAMPESLWIDARGDGRARLGLRRSERLLFFRLTSTGPVADDGVELPAAVGSHGARMFAAPLAGSSPEGAVLLADSGLFFSTDVSAGFTASAHLVDREGSVRYTVSGGDRIYFADLLGNGTAALIARNADELAVAVCEGNTLGFRAGLRAVADLPQSQGDLYPIDFDGNGRDEFLLVYPWSAFLLACDGPEFSPRGAWIGQIAAPGARWQLTPDDRHLFGDLDGDGINDWIVYRTPYLGVFLNGGAAPAVEGRVLDLGAQGLAGTPTFLWGDFLAGGGKELLAAFAGSYSVVRWTPEGPRVGSLAQKIERTGFLRDTMSLGNVFTLPWDGREALAVLGATRVTVLRLEPFQETVHAVPLEEWGLWPCDDVQLNDFDADGDADLVVAHATTRGLIENRGDTLRLRWVYAWNAAEGVFEVRHVAAEEVNDGRFVRGDANRDGRVDLSDAITILRHLFAGRRLEACQDSADANDHGEVDVADCVYVLAFLFAHGPLPPAPGPYVAGTDPSPDDLPPCAPPPPPPHL